MGRAEQEPQAGQFTTTREDAPALRPAYLEQIDNWQRRSALFTAVRVLSERIDEQLEEAASHDLSETEEEGLVGRIHELGHFEAAIIERLRMRPARAADQDRGEMEGGRLS